MKRLKAHLRMVRTYGLRRWWRYERVRRSGRIFDYSEVFTPTELDQLRKAGVL